MFDVYLNGFRHTVKIMATEWGGTMYVRWDRYRKQWLGLTWNEVQEVNRQTGLDVGKVE